LWVESVHVCGVCMMVSVWLMSSASKSVCWALPFCRRLDWSRGFWDFE
jgi:hypothetical protein